MGGLWTLDKCTELRDLEVGGFKEELFASRRLVSFCETVERPSHDTCTTVFSTPPLARMSGPLSLRLLGKAAFRPLHQ